MMAVTASQVKELRERTGLGMMECKRALEASSGDMELAIDELRKSGKAKASKKASRVASEGVVMIRTNTAGDRAVMIEINSETDFVARDENFMKFANQVIDAALQADVNDIESLNTLTLADGASVDEARLSLIAKIGENINLRRIASVASKPENIGTYTHGSRIGVLVLLEGENKDLAKDIAMHIAASKPLVVSPSDVPAELVAKEKEIYMAQAAGSGKPQEIIEKMVSGKLKKFLDEVSLHGQPFVKDPEVMVANLLGKNRAKVVSFTRFEVGEGIEKESENFVEAVMAQVHGN